MATQTRNPTSDEAASGTLSGSAGTRWQLVDDYPDTSGTDSLSFGTATAQITFGYTAFSIPADSTSISVQVLYHDGEAANGANNCGGRLKCGTSYFNATTHNPSGTGWTSRSDNFATNPATSQGWTVDQINSVGASALAAFGIGSTDSNPAFRVSGVQLQVTYTPPVVTGSGSGSASAQTGSGTGAAIVTGGGTASAPPQTGSGSGTAIVGGAGSGSVSAQTGSGSGEVVDSNVTGSGAGAASAQTGSGAGAVVASGAGAASASAQTGIGSGATVVSGGGLGAVATQTGSGAGAWSVSGSGSGPATVQTGSGSGNDGAIMLGHRYANRRYDIYRHISRRWRTR